MSSCVLGNSRFMSTFEYMSTIELTSKKGTDAGKKLREKKLGNGLPFMINARELSSDQCYLEYPDGSIKLVTVSHSTQEINVIFELSQVEANNLRERFHFSPLI